MHAILVHTALHFTHLARPKDDLGRKIDVVQGQIRQTRRAQETKRQQRIRRDRRDAIGFSRHVPPLQKRTDRYPEDLKVAEHDTEPESRNGHDRLLQVVVDPEKDVHAARQHEKLHRGSQ